VVALASQAAASRRLTEACEARGLTCETLHPARVPPPGSPRAPALLLCRLPSGTPPALLVPLLDHEHAGTACLNRPSALRVAHGKHESLRVLAAAGLAVPPTVCVQRDGDSSLDALPGDAFVVKPATGGSGRGVTVGLSREAARRCAEAFADASGAALVQPLLGGGIDRRLFVVGGRVVAALLRRPAGSDGRGNLLYGADAAPLQPTPDEAALALAAVEALSLDVAAADLLEHEGRSILLEVNACPGLAGIEQATGRDVAGAIAELAAARCRR
jgi:ribosomal protein S6--L-glutamate ligase